MKKLSFLDKLFYIINSILAVLLLLSYLLVYFSPKIIPVFTVISLFVPSLIIINILFVVYWIVKLKKQFFLSLVILIIGHFVSTPFYKLSDKNSAFTDDLKVMSFNIKLLNLIKNEEGIYKNGYEFIREKKPDVLVLQENFINYKNYFSFPFKYNNHRKGKHPFGMSIYSKFPIINKGSLNIKSKGNNIIFADIVKGKDTIRIYNIHLESLRIQPDKDNFGEKSSEKLLQRVENAFKKQAEQVEIFLNHQKTWKGKQIVTGDFNNTAYSWAYKQIANNKKDAFIESGKGFGKSYDYWFPMRIDFILTDNTATVQKFETFNDVVFSDHFPIFARVNW
jgi:endonuclease/exonuclease/phosphatase family metal-dependent hydrolase